MNSSELTKTSVGVRYGVILGISLSAYFLILSILGQDQSKGIYTWIAILFDGLLVFLAHKYFKDNGNGFMTYGQGVGISFWQGLIYVLIYSPIFYIYTKFVDTSYISNVREKEIEKMVDKGMSQEQIDGAMNFVDKMMNSEVMTSISFIIGLFFIVGFGLIISFFTKKEDKSLSYE